MKNFDEQLLRLKQAVKLTADQDVAALLGMSKEAFHQRKKRDAFPEDKLFALATKRPDLNLDVLGILAGDKKHAAIKLTVAELEAALEFDNDKSGTIAERFGRAAAVVEMKHAPLPTDEQMWLDCYREWSSEVKKRELKRAMGVPSSGINHEAISPGGAGTQTASSGSVNVGGSNSGVVQTHRGSHSVQQNFHKPIKGDVVGRDKIVPSSSSTTRGTTRNEKR